MTDPKKKPHEEEEGLTGPLKVPDDPALQTDFEDEEEEDDGSNPDKPRKPPPPPPNPQPE